MFYADLHVHSRHSRATSRECDLEHLADWAARKGLAVVATGDFTHPGWLGELGAKLVPAEPGLFRLRRDLERAVAAGSPRAATCPVRFMLQVEISTIYKKDDRTRKVHHLLYVPSLDHAARIVASLERIGNLKSDGRPILGLDSRNLLEIALQSGEGSYLVPAHVWTPWFAALGSKSGFDSIEQCYADLAGEIFALETGLSSDPPMNRRLSSLDRYTLVSNSDAHSPAKLARECCVFDCPLDYFAMRDALKTGAGYGGTVEFFPEEGKYHMDGHRKCGVCLEPDQSRRHGGRCPVCGKPLTLGVMHRVCELADRPGPPHPPPRDWAPHRSLIPLAEVLSEILGVGPQSKAVQRRYEELTDRLGPELSLLEHVPLDEVARDGSPVLAEALRRMRAGQVIRRAGYDGEYGVIRLFTDEEIQRQASVGLLFEMPEEAEPTGRPAEADGKGLETGSCDETPAERPQPATRQGTLLPETAASPLDGLDPDQRAAAEAIDGPVLILAGPGTGKTRTLTHRLAHLIADCGAEPESCLALTFSRRAAAEMQERLERLLAPDAARVLVTTFHALGLSLVREYADRLVGTPAIRVAAESERREMLREVLEVSPRKAARLLARIARRKRGMDVAEDAGEELARACAAYDRQMRERGWLDFDDLVLLPVRLLGEHPDVAAALRGRFRWVSVDELQDIDASQYALLRLLMPPEGNLCAIGDPDQAIYGFRGADVGFFQRFADDYPTARAIRLGRNYRSTQTIVDAALQLIRPTSLVADRKIEAFALGPEQVEIHACRTDKAEAETVVHTIERLLGGSTFFSLDSERATGAEDHSFSFSDFAVLYRTEAQSDLIVEALARSGMPFQRRNHEPLAGRPRVQAAIDRLRRQEGEAAHGEPLTDRLERAWAESGEEQERPEPLPPALRGLAARCGSDLAALLGELALGVDADTWDPRADRIALLTLHAAKGLEFPVVFVVGCEDGLLPLRFGAADETDLAEERRLLFVGMTRARQRLYLTHAHKRFWRGKVRTMAPSPLLDDVEQRLLAIHQHRAIRKPAALDRQRSLFE